MPAGFDLGGLLYVLCVFALLLVPALFGRRGSPPDSSDSGSDDGWGNSPTEAAA